MLRSFITARARNLSLWFWRKVEKGEEKWFHHGLRFFITARAPYSLILVLEKSGEELRKVVSPRFALFHHGSGLESLIVVLEKIEKR